MESTTPAWNMESDANCQANRTFSCPCNLAALTFTCLAGIVVLVGLAGNSVVLWLLGFRMRRNAFSVYILNLAVADFLFLCFLMIESLNTLSAVFNYRFLINEVFNYVWPFPYLTGLGMLSAISTERCMSALWPIWYRCRRPRHTSAVVCGLLWALVLLLNIPEFLCVSGYIRHRDGCEKPQIIINAWLVVLFVVLCGSSLALLIRFLCGSGRMRMTRLYVTILLTVLAFLVCGLPFGIVRFSYYWIWLEFKVHCYLLLVSMFLTCVNSSANPVIYFFAGSFRQRRQQGRQTLRQVLQRALQDTPEVDEPGGSLPQGSLELSESR
ncbi:mas-related G-protein coupled receptor member X3-like [Microcebus murinus]|uniref:mas-related G-protein coupled receptor member X3-like n=1 Tax=Microcebus murinus TaxID=30608 RepID=UPI003F6D8CED